MSNQPTDVFLQPRLVGRRFENGTIPVPVLQELIELRTLVVEIARHVFKQTHPQRKRLPRGFAERFELALAAVDHGSAVPILTRRSSLAWQPDLLADEIFEQARETLLATMDAANENLEVSLPPHLLRRFDRLGRHLGDGESIVFTRAGGAEVTFTQRTRQQLARIAGDDLVTTEVTLRGPVVEVNDNSTPQSFGVRVGPHVVAHVDYAPSDRASVISALTEKWSVRCVLDATVVLSRRDTVQQVSDVHRWEFEDAVDEEHQERITHRIDEIRSLADGWMDGQGTAPSEGTLEFARRVVLATMADVGTTPRVYLYPTPDGGVRAEWETDTIEISLEVTGESRAFVASLHRTTGEDTWTELTGDEFSLATSVAALLRESASSGDAP